LAKTIEAFKGSRLSWSEFNDRTQNRLDEYFEAMTGQQRSIAVDDGTRVNQARQTIKFFEDK
jgi:hypothetical protein